MYGPRDLYSIDVLERSADDVWDVSLSDLDVYGPLVQAFPDGPIRSRGAKAIAGDGHDVVLFGGYGDSGLLLQTGKGGPFLRSAAGLC